MTSEIRVSSDETRVLVRVESGDASALVEVGIDVDPDETEQLVDDLDKELSQTLRTLGRGRA